MSRGFRVSIAVLGVAVFFSGEISAQVSSGGVGQLPSFNSVEVPSGGHVILRSASTQRVTFVKGSLFYSNVTVHRGVLVVERCRRKCPPDYQLEVEVQLPDVERLYVANGGWIQSVGRFPSRPEIELEVSNGGTLDARSMLVERVTASVDQGGKILTVAGVSLSATVTHGGVITYWGNARVKRSIEDGGIVAKGTADEMNALPVNDGP